MIDRLRSCSRESLVLLLNERLDLDSQSGVIKHLESCTKCQRQLERLAADDAWWTEVGTALAEDDDETRVDQVAAASGVRRPFDPADDSMFSGQSPLLPPPLKSIME